MKRNNVLKQGDRAAILPFLPYLFREGDDVPTDLIGAKIVRVGTITNGELVIDYCPEKTSSVRRLCLGFGDAGIWISPPALDGV